MIKYFVSFIMDGGGYGSTTVEIQSTKLTESMMIELHRLLGERYKNPIIVSLIKLDEE